MRLLVPNDPDGRGTVVVAHATVDHLVAALNGAHDAAAAVLTVAGRVKEECVAMFRQMEALNGSAGRTAQGMKRVEDGLRDESHADAAALVRTLTVTSGTYDDGSGVVAACTRAQEAMRAVADLAMESRIGFLAADREVVLIANWLHAVQRQLEFNLAAADQLRGLTGTPAAEQAEALAEGIADLATKAPARVRSAVKASKSRRGRAALGDDSLDALSASLSGLLAKASEMATMLAAHLRHVSGS